MLCIRTVSYELCFNGASIGPIIPSRGICQGDPLSPYLFLFCVETLSLALSKAVVEETIHGVKSGLYLGLPSLVGRSKKRVFGFIKERMWKRLQGWKAKKISRAGKIVLIKNVATAIPSYCMSSFLLRQSMCHDMEVMLNKYWWQSGSTDSKGINWIAWDGLSMSKCQGGNKEYKVLQGYCWILGDGKSIRCTRDPWLVSKSDFKVDQSRTYDNNNLVVADLFQPNDRAWDRNKVSEMFSSADAAAVLSTRIPSLPVVDRLAWCRGFGSRLLQLFFCPGVLATCENKFFYASGHAKTTLDWKEAQKKRGITMSPIMNSAPHDPVKWEKPEAGWLKLNVDATVRTCDDSFSMGLVLRDHTGVFVACKTVRQPPLGTVIEAEALTILEGLQWILTLPHGGVYIESDSLTNVRALQCSRDNLLEVGYILDACRIILDSRPGYSISFVKRQANRVAHLVDRLPCSINCQNRAC
ncbi:uncharacterized protein LOC141713854 [Apium graveolens]|uniref:uncharacterized protein LOC141713854 n=1 Tax=Apium graveolens TaxID=4045 RepID=UPI003D7AF9D8